MLKPKAYLLHNSCRYNLSCTHKHNQTSNPHISRHFCTDHQNTGHVEDSGQKCQRNLRLNLDPVSCHWWTHCACSQENHQLECVVPDEQVHCPDLWPHLKKAVPRASPVSCIKSKGASAFGFLVSNVFKPGTRKAGFSTFVLQQSTAGFQVRWQVVLGEILHALNHETLQCQAVQENNHSQNASRSGK